MKRLVLLIISALICGATFIGCDKAENGKDWMNKSADLLEHNKNKVSITQGICGTLVKTEGNCMPIIDENSTCKQFPVKREIVVYEYTKMDETTQSSISLAFFEKVNTKLIATTISDKEGFFQLALQPGKYSIFVKENNLLFANGFDGQGGIVPVIVETSKISEINLDMNYDAAY